MKMKKFISPENGNLYIVGATSDIKAIYKSIARNCNTEIAPYYNGSPIFRNDRWCYAICITEDNWMTVINSDTFLAFLMEGKIKKI